MPDQAPRVLISSAGRRVELWRLFAQAIENLGLHGWGVVGTDAAAACAASIAEGPVFRVPRVGDPAWRTALTAAIVDHDVRLIVPTIDTELEAYAAGGWQVMRAVSGSETIAVTRDKLAMYNWALAHNLGVPLTSRLSEADPFDNAVVKPTRGSSSVGLQLGVSARMLRELALEPGASDLLVQRRLVGPEYTVNCFITRARTCAYAIPHERLATRSGEVAHGLVRSHPAVEDLARRTMLALPDAYGPLCVQIIDDREIGPAIVEINARFGGGYPLAHRAGARAPERLLRDAAGLPPGPEADAWEPGWEMFRYDQSAFRQTIGSS